MNVTDSTKVQAVLDAVKKKVDFVNWTESVSDTAINWSLTKQVQAVLKEQATEQALKIIDSRINDFGVKEPTLQRQGSADSGQILLQMPGVENPERVKELERRESQLELMKIVSPPNPSTGTDLSDKRSGPTDPLAARKQKREKFCPYIGA